MTKKTGSGNVEEYQGRTIDSFGEIEGLTTAVVDGKMVVPYNFEYSVYDNLTEAKGSEDWPNDSDILKWVNQTAERSAKASSYQGATSKLKAAYEKSPAFKQAQFVKSAMAMGFSPDEAESLAKSKIS